MKRCLISKICEFCHKEYATKNLKRQFCSRECFSKAHYSKGPLVGRPKIGIEKICPVCGKKYYVTPYFIQKNWKKVCSLTCHKKSLKKEYKCETCGKKFIDSKRKNRRFCSRRCEQQIRQNVSNIRRARVCRQCGKFFKMLFPSGKANKGEVNEGLFCSRKCRGLWRSLNRNHNLYCRIYPRRCSICEKLFIAKNIRTVVCDYECKEEKERQNALESNKIKMLRKTTKKRTCKECNKSFVSQYGDKKRLFCSEVCCKKYSMRVSKSIRRARERGNSYELVDPFYIFRRDKWRCQLCNIKTPRILRGKIKDNTPELDHIIPLAQGGEHSMRNTQCLCRKCNQSKGANTKGQLRLFA